MERVKERRLIGSRMLAGITCGPWTRVLLGKVDGAVEALERSRRLDRGMPHVTGYIYSVSIILHLVPKQY